MKWKVIRTLLALGAYVVIGLVGSAAVMPSSAQAATVKADSYCKGQGLSDAGRDAADFNLCTTAYDAGDHNQNEATACPATLDGYVPAGQTPQSGTSYFICLSYYAAGQGTTPPGAGSSTPADPSQYPSQCQGYTTTEELQACQVGVNANEAGQTKNQACTPYKDSLVAKPKTACEGGFDGSTGATPPTAASTFCNKPAGRPKSEVAACLAGEAGQANGQSDTTTCSAYTDTSASKAKTACEDGYKDAGSTTSGGQSPQCDGGDFGWAICPILQNIQDGVGDIETGVIDPFLQTTPLTTASTSPEYKVWDALRGLANVVFVIVFFVIIFGNLLSISAYTIKKMLPRLVAAAILVQISFFVVSLAVDITNVLGAGLFSLLDPLLPGYSGHPGIASGIGLTTAFVGLAAAATAAALSGTLLIIAVAAFFGVLGVFFTLLFRQVVIVALVITAPIAFAAWVLPGTEKFFKMWYGNLIKVLMMYPLIVLLFATSKLFGTAVSGIQIGAFQPIAAIIGSVAPLFLIPMTFKSGGQLFNFGAKAIQGRASGAQKGLKNSDFAKNSRADAKVKNADRIGSIMAGAGAQKVLGSRFVGAGTRARIARSQTSNFSEQKKRLTDAGATTSDLLHFANGDYDKISSQGSYLKGLKASASAQGAAASLLAENGLWSQTHLAKLNARTDISNVEKDRIRDFALSGKGFGETFKKNRVLALANRDAFVLGADGKGHIDKTAIKTPNLESIRGASGALSGNELANFNSDGMKLLGEMGSDGIGQVNTASIKSLTDNQRLYSSMTDSQRQGIYDAVSSKKVDTVNEFSQKIRDAGQKHTQLVTELAALTAGSVEHTAKQLEVDKALKSVDDNTRKLKAFQDTGGVYDETVARIDKDGVAISGKAI